MIRGSRITPLFATLLITTSAGAADRAPALPSLFESLSAPPSEEAHELPADLLQFYRGLQQPARVLAGPFTNSFVVYGSESSIASEVQSPEQIVVAFNEQFQWDYPDRDRPVRYSNAESTPRVFFSPNSPTFPLGGAGFAGKPFDPWVRAGITPNSAFASMIRPDTAGVNNTRVIVASTTSAGVNLTKYYEVDPTAVGEVDYFQDREMFDVDRTTACGGGGGFFSDGLIALCWDDQWQQGPAAKWRRSLLDIVGPDMSSNGVRLAGMQLSGNGVDFPLPDRGSHFQPVAGIEDGVFWLLSVQEIGSKRRALFHRVQVVPGGVPGAARSTASITIQAAFNQRDSVQFEKVGQEIANGAKRWGVNGMRIDQQGYLDIDRSDGPTRGRLCYAGAQNPNAGDNTKDQGDVFVKLSATGRSWADVPTAVPAAANKTQFHVMMDVDDQGWIHVAYLQNEDGVLNATTVNLYYTVSKDGGLTWADPVMVNDTPLSFRVPPPDLAPDYYLIGDYNQMVVSGTEAGTEVRMVWTGLDNTLTFPRKVYYATTAVNQIVGVGLPSRRPALALGVLRNPTSASAIELEATFAGFGSSRVQILDVQGRQLLAQDLGTVAAGTRSLRLKAGRLAPGIYLVKLTEGSASRSARVVVLE